MASEATGETKFINVTSLIKSFEKLKDTKTHKIKIINCIRLSEISCFGAFVAKNDFS
jgi:hypothetical protein